MAPDSCIRERASASLKHPPSHHSSPTKPSRDFTDDVEVHGSGEKQSFGLYRKFCPYILTALTLLIFGWWMGATVLKATRHRWYALCAPPRVKVIYGIEIGSCKPSSLGLLFCMHV